MTDMSKVPPWLRIGSLVVLSGGYVSQKIMNVKFHGTTSTWKIKTDYGPLDAYKNTGEFPWRDAADFFPWNHGRRQYLKAVVGKPARCTWKDAPDNDFDRIITMHEYVDQPTPYEEDEEMANAPKKNTLYSWTNDENLMQFGTFLAENSDGNYVMEVKGNPIPIVVKPDAVERVMPYTVLVSGTAVGASPVHMKCKKGSVKKGDIILLEDHDYIGLMCTVTKLDTKCDRDNVRTMKGSKLATKPLDTEEDDAEVVAPA